MLLIMTLHLLLLLQFLLSPLTVEGQATELALDEADLERVLLRIHAVLIVLAAVRQELLMLLMLDGAQALATRDTAIEAAAAR